MIRLFIIALAAATVCALPVSAKTLLDQGEELFLQNKPREAAALLESALQDDPRNDRIYLYLGICYEQLGQHEQAISILSRGADLPGTDRALFYYDIGNNYLAMKQATKAAEMYSRAIEINSSFPSPYLNRGNVRVESKQYDAAVSDYVTYLGLKPDDPQRASIEKMISLLKGEVDAEQKRIADEKQKQATEEARRKAVLDSVLNSLNSASSDTKNLSGGNAGLENKSEPLDIAP